VESDTPEIEILRVVATSSAGKLESWQLTQLSDLVASAVAESWLRDLDQAPASLQEILAQAALDIYESRDLPALARSLEELEHEQVVTAIGDQMTSAVDTWGGVRLCQLMGLLAWPEHIPQLIACLKIEQAGHVHEEAANALARVGDPAVKAIIEQLDDLGVDAQISASGALETVGSELAVPFLAERCTELIRQDADIWIGVIAAHPHQQLLEPLHAFLGSGDGEADDAYLLMCTMLGHEAPDLKELERGWREKRRKQNEKTLKMASGGHMLECRESIDVELECAVCGAVGTYTLTEIAIDTEQESHEPYLVDEPPCTGCGDTTSLSLTARGSMMLTTELLVFSAALESGRKPKSPLRFIATPEIEGRKLSVREMFSWYKERIAANPASVKDLLGLANCYHNLGSASNAERYYRKALAADRTCIEAAYSLAQIAIEKDDDVQAMELLQQAIDQRRYWTVYKLHDTSLSVLDREVRDLYDEVLHRLGRDDLPALHPAALPGGNPRQKTGRNQPCPCGSGKKYKKCCLGK
jgi:tetratricopeptide (TPR) repeat protein